MSKYEVSSGIAHWDVRTFFKRWPRFYYFIAVVFGPLWLSGLTAETFLKRYPTTGTILNLGSGPKIIGPEVTNVDIYPYAGVSLVADVSAVPLKDNNASRIISDNVLEHVKDPSLAVKEMYRLLEPGGLVYVAVPFIYPFHSSPSDYQRWSAEGLRVLFRDFEMVEIGTLAGPFSAFCAWTIHTVGFVFSFGSPSLNSLFTNVSMFVLFPVKFLDIIFGTWPSSVTVAAVLYCVVRKR